jgi:hypothetical protein
MSQSRFEIFSLSRFVSDLGDTASRYSSPAISSILHALPILLAPTARWERDALPKGHLGWKVGRYCALFANRTIWKLAGYKENNAFIVSSALVRRKLRLFISLPAGLIGLSIDLDNNWTIYVEGETLLW